MSKLWFWMRNCAKVLVKSRNCHEFNEWLVATRNQALRNCIFRSLKRSSMTSINCGYVQTPCSSLSMISRTIRFFLQNPWDPKVFRHSQIASALQQLPLNVIGLAWVRGWSCAYLSMYGALDVPKAVFPDCEFSVEPCIPVFWDSSGVYGRSNFLTEFQLFQGLKLGGVMLTGAAVYFKIVGTVSVFKPRLFLQRIFPDSVSLAQRARNF